MRNFVHLLFGSAEAVVLQLTVHIVCGILTGGIIPFQVSDPGKYQVLLLIGEVHRGAVAAANIH